MQTIADSQARIVGAIESVVEAGSPGTGVSALRPILPAPAISLSLQLDGSLTSNLNEIRMRLWTDAPSSDARYIRFEVELRQPPAARVAPENRNWPRIGTEHGKRREFRIGLPGDLFDQLAAFGRSMICRQRSRRKSPHSMWSGSYAIEEAVKVFGLP